MKSWRKPSRRLTIALSAATVLMLAAGGTIAYAATAPQPAIKTFTPKSANSITNLDVLRQQIRNYYGDPLGTGTFAPDGNYAKEASAVAAQGQQWLAANAHHKAHGAKAIILDVDDTSLATWNYELASNWAYNPTTNGQYVTGELFPAVPAMVALANQAAQQGYAVFFLTGRGAAQDAATLGNLTSDGIGADAGYPAPP